MAEVFFIQKKRFMMLVRETMDEVLGNNEVNAMVPRGYTRGVQYRIERDALIALQISTEALFTTVFEMAYLPL
jgi:hypothetical protein